MESSKRILHVRTNRAFASLREAIAAHTMLGESGATELIELGAVYVNHRREMRPEQALPPQANLRIHLNPRRFPFYGIRGEDLILAEHQDFIVAAKPAGLPSHATLDNNQEHLIALLTPLVGPLHPAQRLDQMTLGLIVLARTPRFHRLFQSYLKSGRVQKNYLALTQQPVPLGHHLHHMCPSHQAPRALSEIPVPNGKACRLEILSSAPLEGSGASFFQSEVRLITGRTHQIRAQLSHLGAPLAGDTLYGAPTPSSPLPWPSPLISLKLQFPDANSTAPFLFILPTSLFSK